MTLLERQPSASARPRAFAEPTLCAAFQRTARDHPDRMALRDLDGDSLTWRQYALLVRRAAAGLAALGVRRGDVVALMLSNRSEFHVADAAAMHLGAVPCSLYNTSPPPQLEPTLRNSGARVAITEACFAPTLRAVAARAQLESLVVIDDAHVDEIAWEALLAGGDDRFDFERSWRAVAPEDLLCLVYTSGTTGEPKGVELDHRGGMLAANALDEALRLPRFPEVVSYLPMAHVAERSSSHYLGMLACSTTTCCPDPQRLLEALRQARPTLFFSVPRVWEKLKASIAAATDGAGMPVGQLMSFVGLDRCEAAYVGAAPTPPAVLEFFDSIGMPLADMWGMSELYGVATANRPGAIRLGTVGQPLPGVAVRIAEDGEVLVRTRAVTRGYRGRPDLTAELIDADGWVHTGDLGRLSADGYLTIVGRKKELIVNAAGKNMSPLAIESTIRAATPIVEHACCIGDGRRYNVALVTLDPDAGVAPSDPETVERVREGLERANERLARVEQIKRFAIVKDRWLPGRELTPTLKLRRSEIEARYSEMIELLYVSGHDVE